MMSTTRHMIKRPIAFLSLAPVHSESFPKAPATPIAKAPVESPVAQTAMQTLNKPVDSIITAPLVPSIARRHSSTSSVGSQRFLRLGPVHWGDSKGEADYTSAH